MKRVVVTMSVFSMVAFGASVLRAVQPNMFTDSGSGTGYVGDCAGFEVWEDITYEVVGKDYFDEDNAWVKSKLRWTVEGKVFNYGNPDKYLPYKNVVYTEHYDAEAVRITGLWALVTVPGEGAIFMDVGLLIRDYDFNILFEAGKHQWWNANVDALCGHLAD